MLRLALKMLLRDARAGELRVLALALVLASGSVTSVAFFADRVRQALTREAHQVLGADMLMTADHAWSPEFSDEIAKRGLARAESVNFVSMARAGDEALLAAGERESLRQFEEWARAQLGRGERIDSLENARPEVRAGLDRAQSFLGLTAMLAVILSAVAVALGTRRYTERHLDGYAVMRCMGATQSQLFALFAWEFLLLAIGASAAGCALGFVVQGLVAWSLAALIPGTLPAPGPIPLVQGGATGLVLLLGFALPPLLQLKEVPALRVIRRDVGPPTQGALTVYVLGLVSVFALLLWQAGELKLAAYVFGGFAAAFGIFAALGYGALKAIGRYGRTGGISWRYGLANLVRRPRANTVQIVAIAVGLTAILLLTVIRVDLIDVWRGRLPADAPDRFLVNIQPEQRQSLAEFFEKNGVKQPQAFPMVRARLVTVNGKAVGAEDFSDERAKRQIEREFNVTYMSDLPPDNKVTAGAWFGPNELARGAISIEYWIAERFGVRVGDTLEFLAAGRSFSAGVTSVRKLEWDSMRPNFFFITTPALLEGFPASYVAAFHAPRGDPLLTVRLSQAFPNVTVIDVTAILAQAQRVMDQLIGAVQLVFLFALAAGVLVLYAALLATQDERTHEAAVMRALGASRAQVLAAQRAEFAVLGAIAGLLAALGATAIGWTLATQVFQFEFFWNGWIWLAGPALGLACVVLNAWAGARAALSRPPMAALREGG